jgi:hypothetical protein
MLIEKLDLEVGEEVLTVVRKHWLILASELFGVVMAALIPIILLVGFLEADSVYSLSALNMESKTPQLTFVITAWLLFSTLAGFVIWTHYYLDLWVITDRRIIAVEQIGFFNRSVAIFRLERLQDIEFSIHGLIQTFFNFGTISAQTAGHNEANFKSTGMPNPDQLQATIQKAMDARLAELNNRPNLSAAEQAGE